jgi:hypothetical protein
VFVEFDLLDVIAEIKQGLHKANALVERDAIWHCSYYASPCAILVLRATVLHPSRTDYSASWAGSLLFREPVYVRVGPGGGAGRFEVAAAESCEGFEKSLIGADSGLVAVNLRFGAGYRTPDCVVCRDVLFWTQGDER